MPAPSDMQEMSRFEDFLTASVEQDGLAVLTAILTFDGARQWVYYTRDIQQFAERLSAIPDFYGDPYPLEISTQEDPIWSYLREQILGPVDYSNEP